MRIPRSALIACVACAFVGCSPQQTMPTPLVPALLANFSTDAELIRWAASPWEVEYSFCYSMSSGGSAEIAGMKFKRADFSLVDANHQVYRTWSHTNLIGDTVGSGFGSCFNGRHFDILRPISPYFIVDIEYGADGAAPLKLNRRGPVTSKVPPPPFITGATLTEDIVDFQNIIRQPGPVTFTVTNVQGGTPPLLYQFKLNGFLMRDWDPNPTYVWPGLAQPNGGPLVNGGYTMAVNIRRSTWPEIEWGTTATFIILLQ